MIYTVMISNKAKTLIKNFTLSGNSNCQQAKQIATLEALRSRFHPLTNNKFR